MSHAFLRRGAARAVKVIYDAVGPVAPPVRPPPGSLFIIDERRMPEWRDDGYAYRHHRARSMPPPDAAGPTTGCGLDGVVLRGDGLTEAPPLLTEAAELEDDDDPARSEDTRASDRIPPPLRRRALRLARSGELGYGRG